MGDTDPLPRRTVLAALGGLAATTTTAQAQDRPYTAEENNIECTFYDCARVEVDAGHQSAHNTVRYYVRYNGRDGPEIEEFEERYPQYPHEFVANCHLDELALASGSAVIERVEVWHDMHHDATFHPPIDWACEMVAEEEVDPRVLEEHCNGETAIERPLTTEENGIEITAYDCARVVVDASRQPAAHDIEINVNWTTADRMVEGERIVIEDPEYPYEFVSNCHLDAFGVDHGSTNIAHVAVRSETERLVEFDMPFAEWDCGEVRQQAVDPAVFEEYC